MKKNRISSYPLFFEKVALKLPKVKVPKPKGRKPKVYDTCKWPNVLENLEEGRAKYE